MKYEVWSVSFFLAHTLISNPKKKDNTQFIQQYHIMSFDEKQSKNKTLPFLTSVKGLCFELLGGRKFQAFAFFSPTSTSRASK